MINSHTLSLLTAGLESLEKDILRQMEDQTRSKSVPCKHGVQEFERMVTLYWDLCDQIGMKKAISMAMEEAMCEAMPSRG